jgi:geranylgeranyl diphosphate synthase, type II
MAVSTSSKSEAAMSAPVGDRARIDAAMLAALARHSSRLGTVTPAVEHALSGGGKRLRGLLTLAAYRACGGQGDASGLAAAVEIVHAYSLVHDDLPCMDDDVVRRGRPTVHVVFGVNAATVAGVAMVPLAAAATHDACMTLGLDDGTSRAIVARLMGASGAGGMVGGQLLDLLAEGSAASLDRLESIHLGKTASLIAAAASLGGIAAGATAARVDALDEYGVALGLAFQIMDDVLDVTSTTEALGKTAGRDTALQKSTYPGLMGLEAARSLAQRKVDEARAHLAAAGILTDDLGAFAGFVVDRAS